MSAIFIAYLLNFDLCLFMALQTSGYNMQIRCGSKIDADNVAILTWNEKLFTPLFALFRYVLLNPLSFGAYAYLFGNLPFERWLSCNARILSVYKVIYHQVPEVDFILWGTDNTG